MGALIRAFDWSKTALGEFAGWPQGLRTAMRLMLNTHHPIYIIWGEPGICLYNDGFRPSIGAERHPQSLGQPARQVWDEIWDIIGPQIEQVMSGQGATWHENQLIPTTRNGLREDVYWTYSYSPIDDESAPGGVGGVLVICSETTNNIQTVKRLAKSEERLELALSAGRGIGTWDWNVPQDRVVADARFAALYGVNAARAAAGAPIEEFFGNLHPEDLPRIQGKIDEALRTGELFSEEYRLLQADGRYSWVLAEGRCELNADGQPLRFPGVSFDITDRKTAEQQLKDLNADLERKVLEKARARGLTWQVSPELLGVLNGDGYFENSNPAWAATLGWSEEEVASRVFFQFVHPDDQSKTQAAWDDAIKRGMPALGFENRYICKDGTYRWLSWVAVPEGGKVYCSARDVMTEKAQAVALETAEAALRQAQKMEAVGQLTGGLAHDFNNLLMGISGSLELIQSRVAQGRTGEIERYVMAAQGAAKRAASLTHRLLAFSRLQTLDPKPVDVNRLLAGVEDLIRRTAGPEIALDVRGATGLWTTLVDANQLENVVLNLCINARDAMPHGGVISLETANCELDESMAGDIDLAPGQYVSLSVRDNGTGMHADVIAKAFDPFFTTKPLGMGTGLGLSMTYGFVRQSGGQVRINSVLGQGTTMRLYLPRHASQVHISDAGKPRQKPAETASGETVLVVDDEEVIRFLVAEAMQEAGFKVLLADDGISGLRLLHSRADIDLLVTDVGLPGGMNGRQLADAARRSRPELPILFITGYAETTAMGSGDLETGMAVMTKPFEIDMLLARSRQMLATG